MSKRELRALLAFAALPILFTAGAADARAAEDEPRAAVECTDHCYVLEQLVLRGDARKNTVRFVLTGQVLAGGPQIIPLFGSPTTIGITDAKINGGHATIGFDPEGWYLRAAERRFTVTGLLTLGEDTGLQIKGPVNVVEASSVGGYVAEGNRFTGVSDLSLTFEKGDKPKEEEPQPPAAATTYELWRFIDAGPTTTFDYRLNIWGSAHLVEPITLPLPNGETVKEVVGAKYSVSGGAITLTPSGPTTEVAIRGTLNDHATFSATNHEETVVLHTDADYELRAEGTVTGIEGGSTPFVDRPSATTSRAFHLQPGQKLDVSTRKRPAGELLPGVIETHARTAVWSASGELVLVDTFTYDNSALGSLRLHTDTRPIFLALDGSPGPVARDDGPGVFSIPLRTGRHEAKVQSLDHRAVRWLGGRLALPMPSHGLTESTATVSLGLPAGVHPVLTTGGDERAIFGGVARHALGFGLALVVSLLVFARARSRVLATVAAFGAFCLAPGLSAAAAVLAVGLMLVRSNYTRLSTRTAGLVAAGGGVVLSIALAGAAFRLAREEAPQVQLKDTAATTSTTSERADDSGRIWPSAQVQGFDSNVLDDRGKLPAAAAGAQGDIRPVELPMPRPSRSVTIQRTFVTRARPFAPTLYYVTDAFLALLGALWLASLGGLAWIHRSSLFRTRAKLRELLTPPVAQVHGTPVPPHPPYRSAHHDP